MLKLRSYPIFTILFITSLISCNNNQLKINEITSPVKTHTERISTFLENPVDENLTASGKKEWSRPNPIHLSWSGSSDQYKVNISENSDMSNSYSVTTSDTYYDLYNIKLNTKYYWNVETSKEKSKVSSFIAKEDKVRLIKIKGVTNCRDLGTYKTTDNKEIKQGLIYRTGRFNLSHSPVLVKEITKDGEEALVNQLKVKTEIDLRETDSASGQAYDGYITGVSYKTYRMEYKVDNILLDNKTTIKNLFEEVLANESSYPLAFHCSQGTDRGGCIAYTLLALCGVAKSDLIGDYLLSNYSYLKDDGRRFASIANTYPKTLDEGEGTSLMEKTKNVLMNQCNISSYTLDKIRNILVK